MDDRVIFKSGEQRKFLGLVIKELRCISLRGILQFGFKIPYPTLKNYYIERRLIPKTLFLDICHISKIHPENLNIRYIAGNFGQIKGGKNKIKHKIINKKI